MQETKRTDGVNAVLSYEQEVHALLHSAASSMEDLLQFFEMQCESETGEAKRLTLKCIEWKREDLRRIRALIPQALERREAASSLPAARSNDLAEYDPCPEQTEFYMDLRKQFPSVANLMITKRRSYYQFDAEDLLKLWRRARASHREQASSLPASPAPQLVAELKAARTAWHEDFGVPISMKYAKFLEAIGNLQHWAETRAGDQGESAKASRTTEEGEPR